MTRAGMAPHLASCAKRAKAVAAADAAPGEAMPLVHLQAQPAWGGDHWLQLEVDGTATLNHVDEYLRAIWLECCGHMSRFTYGERHPGNVGMARKVADVFRPDVELVHIYDFGTESVTLLRAVALRRGKPTTEHPIALMARNEMPAYLCQVCDAPATHLCLECAYEYEEETPGTLCDEHARTHPHEDYGEPMPLVNSPRQGLCGYDGPAQPPY
jgi:hypothetical protein